VLGHCWLGDRKSIQPVGCWFVAGDNLTGALLDLHLQLSPPLPSSSASIKLANAGSAGKTASKTERQSQTVISATFLSIVTISAATKITVY